MRILIMLVVLAVSLSLAGCSKEESKPTQQSSTPAQKPEETSQPMKQAEQVAQEAKEKVEQMAEQAKETVDQTVEKAKEEVAQAGQQVQEAVQAVTGSSASGESVYNQSCAACHNPGIAGAPKTGDKAAWEARIAEGEEQLVSNAIQGIGTMPAKGGNSQLSDADVRAAVEYMIEQSR